MKVTAIYYRYEGGQESERFRLHFSKKATAQKWATECKAVLPGVRVEIRKGTL